MDSCLFFPSKQWGDNLLNRLRTEVRECGVGDHLLRTSSKQDYTPDPLNHFHCRQTLRLSGTTKKALLRRGAIAHRILQVSCVAMQQRTSMTRLWGSTKVACWRIASFPGGPHLPLSAEGGQGRPLSPRPAAPQVSRTDTAGFAI